MDIENGPRSSPETTQKAVFIDLHLPPDQPPQTMPTQPEKRISEADVRITNCDIQDAHKIAEGFYAIFDEAFHTVMEPPANRPPQSMRCALLSKRIKPMLALPHTYFVKAIHIPTNEVIGIAGWMSGQPVHNPWRYSAGEYYGWVGPDGWSDEEVQATWGHVDITAWDKMFGRYDRERERVMKGEPHWYLSPLMVWPEWQGRGIGKLLMEWGMKRAAQEGKPCFLESLPTATAVYLHLGFVSCGETRMIWRKEDETKVD